MNTESSASAPVPSPVPSIVELLGHAEWARRLARELTADEGRAEDAVQDAYVAALEHPPGSRENVRGWFARVLANRIRMRGRTDTRRARRERASARDEALPSASELAGEIEWQRRIAAAVLELDEPQRTTVVLHFYREIPLAEIARRQGEPAATVRTRLKRALDQLRVRFDREHGGDRRAWTLLLASWSTRDASTVALSVSGSSLAAWVAVALLAGGGTWWLWKSNRRPSPSPERVIIASNAVDGSGSSSSAAPPDGRSSSSGRDVSLVAPSNAARSALADSNFFGVIRDLDGHPIPNAMVSLYPNPGEPLPESIASGVSGPDGRFAFHASLANSTHPVVGAVAGGFEDTTLDRVQPDREIVLELGWLVTLGGIVRDAATKAPLAGVEIFHGDQRTVSDAQGRYEFTRVSSVSRTRLRTRFADYIDEEKEFLVRGPEAQSVDFELARGVPLEVEVFDHATGSPLANVDVSSWSSLASRAGEKDPPWTRTDERGRFTVAVANGRRVALILQYDGDWPLSWEWTPDRVESARTPRLPMMRLISIHGRITDDRGAAIAEATVHAQNGLVRTATLETSELQELGTPGRVSYGSSIFGRPGFGPPAGGEVRSDIDGRYSLPVFPNRAPYTLQVRCRGFLIDERGPFLVSESSADPVIDAVLQRAAVIHGRVHGGKEVSSGRVVVFVDNVRTRDQARTSRGKPGDQSWIHDEVVYSLEHVPPGACRVELQDDGFKTLASAHLVVEAGKTYEQDLEVPARDLSGRISGRVRALGGTLPSGVSVTATPREGSDGHDEITTAIAGDGTFVLQVVPGKEYEVRAWIQHPRFLAGEAKSVEPNAADVELTLPQAGRLRLCFVEAGTSEIIRPAASSLINALRWRPRGAEGFRSEHAEFDARGCLEIALAVGTYDVKVDLTKAGYRPVAREGIAVTDDIASSTYTLEVERGWEARLRFLARPDADADTAKHHAIFVVERGQLESISGPFPGHDPRVTQNIGGGGDRGIHLRIEDEALMSQFLDRTEFFGEGASLIGLAAGHYFVKCFPDDLEFEPSEFDVKGPDRTDVEIRWAPRAR